jgi:mitochondrial fission protein ELM1
MPLRARRRRTAKRPYGEPARPRPTPDCVILGVRPGVTPSGRPPVRIFLGSEPDQRRAERVFVWSIDRVRDPARVYEIHIMRELEGFDRRGWTTGFTNYRFAIPHFAGNAGRAIYNDADQVYLADPAELFDLDLDDHGYLAIASDDTSVMLIDCARMADVWTLERARTLHKSRLVEGALDEPGCWGVLAPEWNARDDELPEGTEKVIHFTTLHTQPWRPFPSRLVYQDNPRGEIWHELERSANAAEFEVHSRANPSRHYAEWFAEEGAVRAQGLRDGSGAWAPPAPGADASPPVDARSCDAVLARVPDEDVPWALDDLFESTRCTLSIELPWDGSRTSADLWAERMRHAARRRPHVRWELALRTVDGHVERQVGGETSSAPRVWVLADDRPGNATQSVGLADALGWPYELKRLACGPLSRLHNRWLGASRAGIDATRSDPLEPPWPDLIIAAGRRTAPVAQWVRARAEGRTKIVVLGRKAGDAAELFDLCVTPSYTRLFPHPNRLEIAAPLHRVTPERLEEARETWRDRLEGAASPRIAVLVGGTSGQYRMSPRTARRLGRAVTEMARAQGGSLLATTSRRLSERATRAFCGAVRGAAHVHRWSPDGGDNPYLGFLAMADAFVITGDSESMLAETAALGKPVYVFPLPVRRSFRVLTFFREWVWRRGRHKPAGHRGTPRPQGGVERLCARLIDRGFVRPARDLDLLHEALIERGVVRRLGDAFDGDAMPAPLDDLACVVGRVRALMDATPAARD